MSKKVKVLVSVLAAVVLLTIGATATVMAREKPALAPEVNGQGFLASMVGPQIGLGKSFDSVGDNTTAGLLARVATILGIDQQKLEGAFAQARKEMRDEALSKRLQKLVDEGKITQEQADQYKAWLQARPDMAPFRQQLKEWQQARPDMPLPGRFGRFGGNGFRGGMKWAR